MSADTSESEGKENKDLSIAEKARLAGAIWFYGSIDIEHSEKQRYYRPRIVITMPNLLPYKLMEDVGGGIVYAGLRKQGGEVGKQFTLMIKRWALVQKLLKEIKGMVGGLEEEQIDIVLQIIEINRPRKMNKAVKAERLKNLFNEWKQKREELEKWVEKFKEEHRDAEKKHIPVEIWNRAYLLEDC